MTQCNIRFLIDDILVAMKIDPWICVYFFWLPVEGSKTPTDLPTTESRDLAAQQQVCPDLLLDL